MKRKLPQPEIFLGKRLPQHPDIEIVELIGTGRMAPVFRAHNAKIQRDFACKIIPCDNLVGADRDPPPWRNEFLKANATQSSHVVKFNDEGTWEVDEKRFVYWLAEFIRGQSLRNTIKSGKIDIAFVEIFLEEMLEFLSEMQQGGIRHGDLHSGNIIVEDKPRALRGPKFGFKVTDFGVAPVKTGATLFDDFEQLGVMTRELLEKIEYPELSPEDRFVYDWINDRFLEKHFFEHDTAYDPVARNPEALFKVLQEARSAFIAQRAGETRKTLTTPFDYLSCEQIGESHVLLKELYSDKLLGLVKIEERNNLVLTGPRGCGKTTVFRSLSLKHRYHTNDDAPTSLGYIGIYYMCNDLYFSFPRYERPGKDEALNIPLHYLSVTLIRELLESLSLWLPRHFAAEWQFGEASAADALWDLLQFKPQKNIDPKRFASVIRVLEDERKRSAEKQRFGTCQPE